MTILKNVANKAKAHEEAIQVVLSNEESNLLHDPENEKGNVAT